MKNPVTFLFCMLFAGGFLLCGCSTTKFKAFQGAAILEGKGGEVYSVDGVDFWKNGEPARKYKILGVIEESHQRRLPLGPAARIFPTNHGDREEAIAEVAQKNGGDAVIFAVAPSASTADTEPSTEGTHDHHGHHRFTLMVIKYVE